MKPHTDRSDKLIAAVLVELFDDQSMPCQWWVHMKKHGEQASMIL